jgi:hypothetical protein
MKLMPSWKDALDRFSQSRKDREARRQAEWNLYYGVWEVHVRLHAAPTIVRTTWGIQDRETSNEAAVDLAEDFAACGVWDTGHRMLYPPSRIIDIEIKPRES